MDPANWPQLLSDVKMPIAGPWRHGSIKGFLTNYEVKGIKDPAKCGSDDSQIDCVCKVAPLVARYAGLPELRTVVEQAIRVVQNTDPAVRWGLAFADVLEGLVLGQVQSVGEGLEAAAGKADKGGDRELA